MGSIDFHILMHVVSNKRCMLPIAYCISCVVCCLLVRERTRHQRKTANPRPSRERRQRHAPPSKRTRAPSNITLPEVFVPSPHEHRPGGGRKQSGKPTQGARPHDEARRHRSPDATPGTAPNTGTTGNTHTGDPAPMRPSSDPAQHQPDPGLIVFGVDC